MGHFTCKVLALIQRGMTNRPTFDFIAPYLPTIIYNQQYPSTAMSAKFDFPVVDVWANPTGNVRTLYTGGKEAQAADFCGVLATAGSCSPLHTEPCRPETDIPKTLS